MESGGGYGDRVSVGRGPGVAAGSSIGGGDPVISPAEVKQILSDHGLNKNHVRMLTDQLLESARAFASSDADIAIAYCEVAIETVLEVAEVYSSNPLYWSWYWDVRDQIVSIVQSIPRWVD
jgi:hypothetical protein